MGAEDREQRYKDLRTLLGIPTEGSDENYGFGIYGNLNTILKDYRNYKRSGYSQWPFRGSAHDQPWWVKDNFDTLELLEEYFELDKEFGPKQVGNHVARANDLFKENIIKSAHKQG